MTQIVSCPKCTFATSTMSFIQAQTTQTTTQIDTINTLSQTLQSLQTSSHFKPPKFQDLSLLEDPQNNVNLLILQLENLQIYENQLSEILEKVQNSSQISQFSYQNVAEICTNLVQVYRGQLKEIESEMAQNQSILEELNYGYLAAIQSIQRTFLDKKNLEVEAEMELETLQEEVKKQAVQKGLNEQNQLKITQLKQEILNLQARNANLEKTEYSLKVENNGKKKELLKLRQVVSQRLKQIQ